MANRFPLVIDTSDGNKFKELPDGDNLILTNSSIVNALNVSAVGYVEASRFILNGQDFTADYNELSNLPTIPSTITDLVNDGTVGQVLTTNGSGLVTFQNIPTQDPVLGGSLSGTASNANIAQNAVSVRELDVTDGTVGQVLATDGSGNLQFITVSGGGGAVSVNILNILLNNPVRIQTSAAHSLADGEQITIAGVVGTIELNGNSYYADVIGIDTIDLYTDESLTASVNGAVGFSSYDSGGVITANDSGATSFLNLGGTIGLDQIDDDFITPAKLRTNGDTPGPHQYLTVNTSTGFFEYLDLPTESIDYGDILNTPTIPSALTDLGIVDGNDGDILTTDGAGNFTFGSFNQLEGITFSGTQISTELNNTNISISPKGNGYLAISGTNAIVVPSGTTAQRGPNAAGALRLNSEIGIFEGYDGNNWGSLGGVRSVDGATYIKAEATPGASDDKLYFYTNDQETATLTSNLLDFNQNVRLKIKNTENALDFDTGALSVDGGVSIRGNLLVSGTIDVDETFDTSAAVEATMVTGTLTNSITVAADDMPFFKVGQKVRVFGASADNTVQGTNNMGVAASAVGFTTPDGSGDEVTFSYRVAQFDFTTGKVSASVGPANVQLEQADLLNFNNSSNIQLVLARQSSNHGILLYRKIGAEANFSLIKVLGPKELGTALSSISYTDYYDFDLVDWSNKTSTNAFDENSGIVHMPLTAPIDTKYGWFDTEVDSIDLVNNRIETTQSFYADATGTVVIDDTELVQLKIDQAKTQNRNSYELENRTYFIKQLKIPSSFTLYGQGDQTRIRKQFWSTDPATGSNSILTVDTDTYATQENISVKNLRIDGSHVNQYLAQDTNIDYLNYAIRIFGNDILFENIELEDTVGGGIYCYNNTFSENVTVLNCEITNGGLTYTYDYSPLYASESRSIKIAHNTFRNYPDAVYVDAVSKGIVSPNVVDNCGAGIFAYGASKIVLTPNVLLGPASEFIANPDVLNSEYDSVNIRIEQNTDFNSPNYTYQENGELFDFTANQGVLTPFINELVKTNNVEELSTDYSETLQGNPYIQFTHDTDDLQNGNIRFRIQQSRVNDLLQRAGYNVLLANNPNTQGLVYRIVHTEYVPLTTIIGQGVQGADDYIVTVDSTSGFVIGDIIRLVSHQSTPSTTGVDGTITTINNTSNEIGIDFGALFGDVNAPGTGGSLALKNSFIVTKGKIN
jgi:hypothetical protein